MRKLLILILLWCGVNSAGELLIKLGTGSLMDPQTPQELWTWIWQVIRSPLIMAGVIVSAFDLLLWIFILKSGDLSVVVPLTSLNYIFALAVGCIIFHEAFTVSRVVGILLICGGTYFLSR
ncbi:putative membrane protein [Sporomusaceae bacterium BoRhaA]|uniref:EamA family transporter n=1 Tax=Pelorhabdus rhamnosifermentans TaxID=2772457 RepID=UPI001C062A80|nr:EamA family transporter [Pelorhabdus rhamnosifermentans]MBU2702190.1 putative membrane protein [Pelorhabdus rhamnosifermentans]